MNSRVGVVTLVDRRAQLILVVRSIVYFLAKQAEWTVIVNNVQQYLVELGFMIVLLCYR